MARLLSRTLPSTWSQSASASPTIATSSSPLWQPASTSTASGRSAATLAKPRRWPPPRDAAAVHAAIGLQTRANAAAIRARALLASGAIGRVLSARVYSSTAGFGPVVPAPYLYLEDPANGVNLVTIQGAHTIDLAIALLGGLADLAALNTIQYPEIETGDDRTKQRRSTFDHMLLQARLAAGGALSVEVAGGRAHETPFRLEVVGEEGVLALAGGAPRGFQSGRLRLLLNDEPQTVDEGQTASLPDAAANVAGIYAALRDDILQGTSTAPGFQHAVRLSRLIDAVMRSSQTGNRAAEVNWPA